MPTPNWDERHATSLQSGAQPDPSALVVDFASPLPPGRALDLACGLGRHALWLARRGWQVTAVDASTVTAAFLQQTVAKEGLAMDVRIADLTHGVFVIEPGLWDLIVVYHYLQADLFPSIKDGVLPGGLVLASVLLGASEPERFRAAPGELRGYFKDWEILHYKEQVHTRHSSAEIAARKTALSAAR